MKRSDAVPQFLWYLVVGGLAFLVDIGSFVGLTALEVPWLAASASAFVIATVANYFLSYLLAFRRGRFNRSNEIARLFAVAGIGLVLNTAIVWGFVRYLAMVPVIAKIAAVPLVLAWNFLGRRLFVFQAEMPEATFAMTVTAAEKVGLAEATEPVADSPASPTTGRAD